MPLFLNGIKRGSLFLAGNNRATAWKVGDLVFGNSGGGPTPELVRLTPAMTSNTTPAPFVVSASSHHNEGFPYMAFDQILSSSNLWNSGESVFNTATGYALKDCWLMVKLDDVRRLKNIKLHTREAAFLPQTPRDFTIEISDDGQDFIAIISTTDNPFPLTAFSKFFDAEINATAKYIRIRITRNWASGGTGSYRASTALSEIELYGF